MVEIEKVVLRCHRHVACAALLAGEDRQLAGRAAVDELLLRPGLDHHHVENDITKALNNVVDLAVGHEPFRCWHGETWCSRKVRY